MTPEERLKLAFDVAEKDLSIPTLLDVNDLLEGGDEQSMLTYLSYFRIYSREKKVLDLSLCIVSVSFKMHKN